MKPKYTLIVKLNEKNILKKDVTKDFSKLAKSLKKSGIINTNMSDLQVLEVNQSICRDIAKKYVVLGEAVKVTATIIYKDDLALGNLASVEIEGEEN